MRTFLVPAASRKTFSFESIVLNDFRSNVLRLNTFLTYLQVAETLLSTLNLSIILSFSLIVKRLVVAHLTSGKETLLGETGLAITEDLTSTFAGGGSDARGTSAATSSCFSGRNESPGIFFV